MPLKARPGSAQGAPPKAIVRSYASPSARGVAVPEMAQPLIVLVTAPALVTENTAGRTPSAKPAVPVYEPASTCKEGVPPGKARVWKVTEVLPAAAGVMVPSNVADRRSP